MASSTDQESSSSTKPTSTVPPRKHPEFMELSERKQALVQDFYDKVWSPYSKGEKLEGDKKTYAWPKIFSILNLEDEKIWCYKLMVARKFELEEAKKMLQAILDFREEFKTESRSYFPPPFPVVGIDMQEIIDFFQEGKPRDTNEDVDRIAKHTEAWQSVAFYGRTKWGHPVWYECFGLQHPNLCPLTLKQLADVSKGETYLDVHLRYHVFMTETGIRLAHFQDKTFGKKHNEKVSGLLCVCDMQGLGMHQFSSEFTAYLSQLGEFDKKVYPEFLHHVLVINCPTLIRAAFAIVAPLIDARTQTKISFHGPGEATRNALREWMDDEQIPPYLLMSKKAGAEEANSKIKSIGDFKVPNYDEQEKLYQSMLKAAKDGDHDHHSGLAQVGVEVPAGKNLTREIAVKKEDMVSWEWISDAERTVEFSVTFKAEGADAAAADATKTIVQPDKITKHSGNYTAEADGKVTILFGNEFSWMRSKYLTLKTARVPGVVAGIEIDGGDSVPSTPAAEDKKEDSGDAATKADE